MERSKNDIWVGLFVILGAVAILFLALQAANLLPATEAQLMGPDTAPATEVQAGSEPQLTCTGAPASLLPRIPGRRAPSCRATLRRGCGL